MLANYIHINGNMYNQINFCFDFGWFDANKDVYPSKSFSYVAKDNVKTLPTYVDRLPVYQLQAAQLKSLWTIDYNQ